RRAKPRKHNVSGVFICESLLPELTEISQKRGEYAPVEQNGLLGKALRPRTKGDSLPFRDRPADTTGESVSCVIE
ncbi:MAG: hypothetical protein KHW46_04535, partial [Clostridiales bacterium]|nr:hypothetical protein [Clostridiales bacterium]